MDQRAAGHEAARRHAWREAVEFLRAADTASPLPPEDLQILGEAAWWSGQQNVCLAALERAYAGFLDRGELNRAGYVALTLASEYQHRQADAVAAGWFHRAR